VRTSGRSRNEKRLTDDLEGVRAAFLVLVLCIASCGDEDARPLVSGDVARESPSGCVVPEGGAVRADQWKVREGDSLRRIARRVYGNEELWKAIRDANRDKVGRDDSISVGEVLVIPRDGI
jgi:hypothetical protein